MKNSTDGVLCIIPVDKPKKYETIRLNVLIETTYDCNIQLVILQIWLIILPVINRVIED